MVFAKIRGKVIFAIYKNLLTAITALVEGHSCEDEHPNERIKDLPKLIKCGINMKSTNIVYATSASYFTTNSSFVKDEMLPIICMGSGALVICTSSRDGGVEFVVEG